MIQRLLIIVGLLYLFSVAQAQDNDIPSADDIFVDGVTVLARLPVLQFDRENREVDYFDPDTLTWNSYPYPDEVERFNRYEERSDGTYLLQRGNDDNGRLTSYDNDWIFDPLTGAYSRDDMTCGRMTALSGAGEWVIHQLETGVYVLCDTETGEQISLSNDLQANLQCGNRPDTYTESPDREWVVFHDCANRSPLVIYTMNTQTGIIHYSGEISINYLPYWLWLNDDLLLLDAPFNIDGTFSDYSLMRPSQENSLINVGTNLDIDLNRSYIAWDEVLVTDNYEVQNTVYVINTETYEQTILYDQFCENSQDCLKGGFVAISPSQRYVAYGSSYLQASEFGRNSFIIFDAETQESLYEQENFPGIYDLHWITESKLLINSDTHYEDGVVTSTISILDISTNPPSEIILDPESIHQYLRILPDNESIILQNDRIYHFPTEQEFDIFQPHIRGYLTWERSDENFNLIATTRCMEIPCNTRWRIQIDAISEANS